MRFFFNIKKECKIKGGEIERTQKERALKYGGIVIHTIWEDNDSLDMKEKVKTIQLS